MDIPEIIINYIKNPLPLWNEEVANVVIDYKWDTSLKDIFRDQNNYTITGCILKDETQKEKTCILPETNTKIQVAFPSNNLSGFYDKHGLTPEFIDNSLTENLEKIKRAMRVLSNVAPLHSCILQLVKSMQIIAPANLETDISYSHPDIPFSIFFSVCEDNSIISDLRVAESILHESMHLFLTLIENVIPMIKPDSKNVFYSPWRNEERPLRGVLHGLFVFRAILGFYTLMAKRIFVIEVHEYLSNRISEIKREIDIIIAFPQSEGLTIEGQKLSSMLLTEVIYY